MAQGNSPFWDYLNLTSFLIGLANYSENLSQSQLQGVVTEAVKDIHQHLQEQDQKINLIISKLEEMNK